jgi:hypothetical protein
MSTKRVLFTLLVFVISFCQWHYCGNVSGEEKLAVINKYKGDVTVQHEGNNLVVEKRGARIKNASIYDKDSISTKKASTAELVFNDGSRFDINEKTTLTISEEKTTRLNKTLLRRVKIKAGGVLAEIIPSKTVLTEFELPTGVATVRGTVVSINVEEDLLCVTEGSLVFTDLYGNEHIVDAGECIYLSFTVDTGVIGKGKNTEQPTPDPVVSGDDASPHLPVE